MPRDNIIHVREKRKKGINPIWRGLGCIAMFLLPVASFGLTLVFSPLISASGLAPMELLGYIKFPLWMYKWGVSADIANFFGGIKDLGLNLIVFFVILIIISGIASLIYVAVMQVIGPPRYSEKDAPPSAYKPKVYKR